MFKLLTLLSVFLLPNNLFSKDNIKKEIEINADNLTIEQNSKTAVFLGNVSATSSDISITSDKMIAHYHSEKNRVSKIEIFNNIVIRNSDQILKGEYGIYNIENNIIELENNVMLVKADNILKSSYLIYNLNNGQIQIFNKNNKRDKIKAIFNPNTSFN